jgi:alpha-tubulin suppressor-like RCC1 family protein
MSRYSNNLNLMFCFLCMALCLTTFFASAALDHKWQQVSAGYRYTVAIKADGSLWAWGGNSSGQLGNGSNTDSDIPLQIGNDTDWLSIKAGPRHVLATKSDGTLWSWGENTFGQLGINSRILQFTTPQQVFTDTDWQKIAAGSVHSLALKSNGTLGAWGSRGSGQLGTGNTSTGSNRFPVQVGSDADWLSIAAGNFHTLAIKTDGTLWVWGDNNSGQLGDGSQFKTYIPVQIGTDTNWLDISGGDFYSIGLKSDGTLWAWGTNFFGQLGLGEDAFSIFTPHKIGLDSDWQAMVASYRHVLAIKTDGSLWAWGDNEQGQLGDGTTIDKATPVQIGSERNWQHLSTSLSGDHSLAIKSDGTLWAWGKNEDGQLGTGSLISTAIIQQVILQEGDIDNDGIVDSQDAFPSIAIGNLTDTDKDGAPDDCDKNCVALGMAADLDDDNDGINDNIDNQPLRFGQSTEIRFSYTFTGNQRGDAGNIITGVIDGMVESDNDTIEILGFKRVSLAGIDYQLSESIGIQAILPANKPKMSLSGAVLDFWVCVQGFSQTTADGSGDCPLGAVLFSQAGLDGVTEPWAIAGIPELGASYRNSDIPLTLANWNAHILTVHNDVDGDGKSDLLWRSSAKGWNFLWTMNGTATSLTAPINVVADASWDMVGQGDYDADGKSDILWRNNITGQNFIYLMDGKNIKVRATLNYVTAPIWEVKGSGDFNGDGKGDVFWRRVDRGDTWFYLMDGLKIGTSLPSLWVTDLNYEIAATGDINGDGTDDVIWRNKLTGINYIWIMQNGQIGSRYTLNAINKDWIIAGTGDLDGDGTDDIILRSQVDGRNWAYLMEKGQIKTSQLISTVGSLDWQIADMGDYDGDGKVDFLWRNESAARNIIHLMDGLTIKDKGVLRPTDNTWQLAK